MDWLQLPVFAGGVALLIGGAWILVDGGSRAAVVLGVKPVIVGLTIVAFGTSAPELFVSLIGALRGNTGLVLGNVVGSNVANIGLILALAAVLRPVLVEKGLVRRELPLLLAASVALTWLVWDGALGRFDSGVLAVGFVAFMVWTLRSGDRGAAPVDVPLPAVDPAHRAREVSRGLLMVVGGIVGLAAGGHLIVGSAVKMAGALGVSETLIGLTMVAVGTSLPELATTVVAALRDQDDLALGNIVGSNLFNILGVAAPVGLIRPLAADAGAGASLAGLSPIQLQCLCMILLAVMMCVMVWFGRGRVGRGRGAALLASYVAVMFLWTKLD